MGKYGAEQKGVLAMRLKEALNLSSMVLFSTLTFATVAMATGREAVLHTFEGTPGRNPAAGVIFDTEGNLYGTTMQGGIGPCQYGCGTVFKLTPKTGGGWTFSVIHIFQGSPSDGGAPAANLVFDSTGNLYGTTTLGGSHQGGTVFELTPNAEGGWTGSVIYEFAANSDDGATPAAGLIFDSQGNLYGTTQSGGGSGTQCGGCGTIFELSPNSGGGWSESVLYRFQGKFSDGSQPQAPLIFDGLGNLYGTTVAGGTANAGTVFELSPVAGGWTETLLYSFQAGNDGDAPMAGLTFDSSGNLYGTTFAGGSTGFYSNGTVFKLIPSGTGSWTETVIHHFPSAEHDGMNPEAPVVFDASGNLFGTTTSSDEGLGNGTVFRLSPDSQGTWTETGQFAFEGGSSGSAPKAGVIFDAAGDLFGTTYLGGNAERDGMVFEIGP